ncbi:MAG: hypothetical protein ACC653_11655 [Gammaproteobacteria bacterium]
MQIQGTSTASALVQYRSTGSKADETANGINPANASARDKQSDDRKQSTQQQAVVEANKVQTIPNLHIQRVTATKPVSNDALASSTHSAKQAVQAFQQIDLLSEPELMHRVDALA